MTKSSTKQRLLAVEDADFASETSSSSSKPRRSLSMKKMASVKKLTSIRNLMGTPSNKGMLLEDVTEEGMQDSFNISFRDLTKSNSNSNTGSLDDSVLGDLKKDQDFSLLCGGKGLQFTKESGLQYTLGREEEGDEGEDDLFPTVSEERSAIARRNHVQNRRHSLASRKSVRRLSGDGTCMDGSTTSNRRRSSRQQHRPRRSQSGDGSSSSNRRRRSSAETTTKRRSTVTSNKQEEHEPVTEETEEESSTSNASAEDSSQQQILEATPEESPLDSASSRRTSSRRPRMSHRAESLRGPALTSFSDQGRSTRKLEASKRDRPSIRISRASTTTSASNSNRSSKNKESRRSSHTATTKREPSRRVMASRNETANNTKATSTTSTTALQW